MGRYAYLNAYDPIDRILMAPEVEAKTYVPLFWLAMFEPAELLEAPLTGVGYKDRGKTFKLEAPYLRSEAKLVVPRLQRRVAALTTLCTATHQPLLKQWVSFAKRLKPAIVVRLSDLAEGSQPGFVDRLRRALEIVAKLDDPSTTPADLMVEPLTEIWSDSTWATSEHAVAFLAGWGWQVTAEERAQRARERKWQKAVGERPPGELLPYVMTRVYAPDELVHHPSLGNGIVLRIVEGSKVEILFRDGPKTLIHARASAP